jgi:hypothetical protein
MREASRCTLVSLEAIARGAILPAEVTNAG